MFWLCNLFDKNRNVFAHEHPAFLIGVFEIEWILKKPKPLLHPLNPWSLALQHLHSFQAFVSMCSILKYNEAGIDIVLMKTLAVILLYVFSLLP